MRLDIPDTNKEFECLREQEGKCADDEGMHPYYQLANGELVSKGSVDNAIKLLMRFVQGHSSMYLTDAELFAKGDKVSALWRFHKKYNTSMVEAKQAIEFLRGETIT